jgi:hypothetical protein
MKIDNRSKIIIGCFAFYALLFGVGSSHATSVDVGGWSFATDIEGWRVKENPEIEMYDSSSEEWQSDCDVLGKWKGVTAMEPFVYPSYPNAPKDSDEYGSVSGGIYISVLKVPDNLVTALRNHDIAVYGSSDKIPEDKKEEEINEILRDATRNALQCQNFDSEKDITFQDHKAHLSEGDSNAMSTGTIAILLDDTTVGIIDVYTEKQPRYNDATIFNGRAWDVIESFTISPK